VPSSFYVTMPSLRSVVAAAAFSLHSVAHAQLNSYALQAGLQYFGSGTTAAELSDTDYSSILSDTTEFGGISANKGFDWATVEGGENQFDYTDGDTIAQYALNNGQILNCGLVIQYDQLPSWGMSLLFSCH
jgi:endo-1,4-beta-xylanase